MKTCILRNMSTPAERLKRSLARLGRGAYSQLARHLGVSPQAVRSWVEEGIIPRGDLLERSAAFLNVDPAWLRFGDVRPGWRPELILEYLVGDEILLIQNFRKSTDDGKAQLLIASEASEKLADADLPTLSKAAG